MVPQAHACTLCSLVCRSCGDTRPQSYHAPSQSRYGANAFEVLRCTAHKNMLSLNLPAAFFMICVAKRVLWIIRLSNDHSELNKALLGVALISVKPEV